MDHAACRRWIGCPSCPSTCCPVSSNDADGYATSTHPTPSPQTFSSTGQRAQEISFQEFRNKLLAQGRVAKLEVANNNMVRVYLRPGFGAPTSSSSSGPEGYPAAASGSTPASAMATAARQAAKQASSGGGTAPGAAAGSDVVQLGGEEVGGQPVAGRREPPAYYFLIGSVDAFERQLEQAQRDLGIPSSAWVPVKYSYEVGGCWCRQGGVESVWEVPCRPVWVPLCFLM